MDNSRSLALAFAFPSFELLPYATTLLLGLRHIEFGNTSLRAGQG